MKASIVLQLVEALGVLRDYPGIDDILNVDKAQDFLKQLEGIPEAVGIPNFTEVDQKKLEAIKTGFTATINEWRDALDKLYYVKVYDESVNDENEVISGCFSANLVEAESDEEQSGYFSFRNDNEAEIRVDSTIIATGTWPEVYVALVNHINTKLVYPDVPETDSN